MTQNLKVSDEQGETVRAYALANKLGIREATEKILANGLSGGGMIDKSELEKALTLDQEIKTQKLEGLKLDNAYKRVRNVRYEKGLDRVTRDKIAIGESERNGVTPPEEIKGFAQEIHCFEATCNVSFPAGFTKSRENHMIESHQWSFEMLAAMGSGKR